MLAAAGCEEAYSPFKIITSPLEACLSCENAMISNANFENLGHLKGIEISNTKLKTDISKTQTILI